MIDIFKQINSMNIKSGTNSSVLSGLFGLLNEFEDIF